MDDLDDSFNDMLANMEMPELPPESTNSEIPRKPNEPEMSTNTSVQQQQSKYTNAIQVNPKQRGNPLLKAITNTPWEFNESIIPDYIVGKTGCVLFLSIRYHNLKPDYIHERLKQLGKSFELRVLLVHVDIKEPHNALKYLTRLCLLADLTLMLAWTPEEAGKIIETYKMFEHRPPDFIMERSDKESNHQKIISALTSIKPVNKTDAMMLIGNFGALKNLIQTTESKLSLCPGLGPRKANKVFKVFNEPFLKQ